MAGKDTWTAGSLLNLVFLNAAWGGATAGTGIAVGATTNSAANFYISLHTNDPTVNGGGQNTNEVSYTGYARMTAARTAANWNLSNDATNHAANITFNATTWNNVSNFGAMTAGTGGVVNFFCIGDASTGTNGHILYCGSLSPNINVQNGVTPILLNNTTIVESAIAEHSALYGVVSRSEPFMKA